VAGMRSPVSAADVSSVGALYVTQDRERRVYAAYYTRR